MTSFGGGAITPGKPERADGLIVCDSESAVAAKIGG